MEWYKPVIVIIFIAIGILVTSIMLHAAVNSGEGNSGFKYTIAVNCEDICVSNHLIYYKYTTTVYANNVCYVQYYK